MTRVFAAVLPALFFIASACAAGDYFYASGERHELSRLHDRWAVKSNTAAIPRWARARMDYSLSGLWSNHGIAIVHSAAGRQFLLDGVKTSERLACVNPVFDYGGGAPLVVADEFIACFPARMGKDQIDSINRRYNAEIVRKIPFPPNSYLLRACGWEELAALSLANAYFENEGAEFAQPNFIARKRTRVIPDDPYFPYQWHLINLGQGGALPAHDIEAPAAWDATRGDRDVIIAVIDDGVDFSHEDLQDGKFVSGYDFYDDDDNPRAEPGNRDYHGTTVTGVAAANGDNGIGVTGVAPRCRVMPIRLVAGETSDEQDARAIRWAAEQGAWIINNSWGPPDGNPFIEGDEKVYPLPDIVRAAIDYAAESGRGGKGTVIVWAAGNGNEPLGYDHYASYEKVIAVGACTDQGVRPFYSDYGPELDVCAPSDGGETPGIATTDFMGQDGYNPGGDEHRDVLGNYTRGFGGTSAAAPIVSGIAALILSREPDLTREEATRRIRETTDLIDFITGDYDLTTGHSLFYGYGRVNAHSAVTGRRRQPELRISASTIPASEGEQLSLAFSLRGGSEPALNYGDAYLAVVPPGGGIFFVKAEGDATTERAPLVPGIVARDMSGTVGDGFPLSGIPAGNYAVYGAVVAKDEDPRNPSSWRHIPAGSSFEYAP